MPHDVHVVTVSCMGESHLVVSCTDRAEAMRIADAGNARGKILGIRWGVVTVQQVSPGDAADFSVNGLHRRALSLLPFRTTKKKGGSP